jgi:sorting nexin-25
MALSRHDLALAAISGFISWGLVVSWFPFARLLGYAFVFGVVLALTSVLVVIISTSRKTDNDSRIWKQPALAFLNKESWRKEIERFRQNQVYNAQPLYPKSFIVSEGVDELLRLATRDFISSWYSNISGSPVFANEIDKALRIALSNLRDRLLAEDMISIIVSRVIPIITAHLKEFDKAERAVRGRNLTRTVTETEELDLAIASKYRDGKLHPALMV